MIFLPVKIDELIGYDYVAALSKKLAIDPETKALKIKSQIVGGGNGGVTTFVALTDTPGSYTGQASKYLRVKATEDGLEFAVVSGNGATTLVGLTDTPGSYSGEGGKYLRVKSSEDGIEFAVVSGGGGLGIAFIVPGTAIVKTKLAQVLIPSSLTISSVIIYSDQAPTGASLIVDVNKNGTTIFTTQGNRPEIAIDGHSDESGTPDITSFAKGDRMSVDIDQIGSTNPGGNDLLVTAILG